MSGIGTLKAGAPVRAKAGGRRWLKWLILGPLLFVILVQLYFFAMVCWWTQFNPSSTSMMRQQLAALREQNPNAKLEQAWVPYARISNNLKRAVIASEDANGFSQWMIQSRRPSARPPRVASKSRYDLLRSMPTSAGE